MCGGGGGWHCKVCNDRKPHRVLVAIYLRRGKHYAQDAADGHECAGGGADDTTAHPPQRVVAAHGRRAQRIMHVQCDATKVEAEELAGNKEGWRQKSGRRSALPDLSLRVPPPLFRGTIVERDAHVIDAH